MPRSALTPNQAEPLLQSQVTQTVHKLIADHGIQRFREVLSVYTGTINVMNAINQDLLEINPQDQADAYTKQVEEAITATRSYYELVGSLPEDFRQFLVLMAESLAEDEEGTAAEIRLLLGEDIPLDATPLLSVQSIRPRQYIMQIDAVSSSLPTLAAQSRLKVGARGSQLIKTTVTLDMPEHMRIDGSSGLSTYDKSIINGITSLLESGNTVFSIPMLYHAMTGKQNPTVDEQLSEEIGGKLEKMRRMILTIDLSEESQHNMLRDKNGERLMVENLTIEGYLLPLNKMSGVINGKKTEVYQIIQAPPLYSYAKMKRQLASAPIELLNAPLNNNSTTIPLKTYLLQRIELMKNKRNNITSTSILYETIYHELGAHDTNKTKKMRIRDYTETILAYFMEQHYIVGYTQYKKGRSIAGIQIVL